MSIKAPQNVYNWTPVPHKVFKDESIAKEIHERGYKVLPLLSEEVIDSLNAIYQKEHQLNSENGGMFYSLYSKDMDYRERVNSEINQLLQPILETHFKDYKNVINSFVVKASGKESEFYVHQDTTVLDEFHHSPLSLWIPLHEINETNGALTVIEKSHWFFSPYRGVSFDFPFNGILNDVRQYLNPIYLKPGEILVFDPRVVHNSMINKSGKDRVAIICGIFHKNAEFLTCFKEPTPATSPIELFSHDENYALKYPHFFYDCHIRPVSGEKVKDVHEHFPPMSATTFHQLCTDNNIARVEVLSNDSGIDCNMIAEPDGINRFDEVETTTDNQPVEKKKSGFFSLFKRS